jgi:hypothetical protein
LLRHSLIGGDDFVERVGDLSLDAEVIAGHPHREIARAHCLQGVQQILHRLRLSVGSWLVFGGAARR